jgi:2-C-methyl-D-erythritol 2,4-cyclodiphosphate synthase
LSFRVGIGIDAHRFVKNKPLVLGGVDIPFEFGLEAHSDGDVLSHAILDAIFGAANLGDKGSHFPPTDMKYSNIRSTMLLESAVELLGKENWKIENVDVSVMCEEPKLLPHADNMRATLAQALRISSGQISIKGTTLEQLGFTGRREGIAALAVVLITK